MSRSSAIVIVVLLTLVPAVHTGEPAKDKKPEAARKTAAEIVDAIVNRNKAPKLVKWPGKFPSIAALFPEDHDWNEEIRARKAVVALTSDRTEEVWEEMVKRTKDRRYSVTSTSVKTGDADIEDVGTICEHLAYSRLVSAFHEHLPVNFDGRRSWLDVGANDLAEWRKQRAGKSLYELQIEVCEKAIELLPKEQSGKTRKKIEAEIENLKRNRKPVHGEGYGSFREYNQYDADLAKRVRDGIKSGKYGDLGIIK